MQALYKMHHGQEEHYILRYSASVISLAFTLRPTLSQKRRDDRYVANVNFGKRLHAVLPPVCYIILYRSPVASGLRCPFNVRFGLIAQETTPTMAHFRRVSRTSGAPVLSLQSAQATTLAEAFSNPWRFSRARGGYLWLNGCPQAARATL